MQIVLRYLPPALTFIALAVLAAVVLRRLPKTAKLEAELATQPKTAVKKNVSTAGLGAGAGKAGRLLARASRGLAVGVGAAAKKIKVSQLSGRLGQVLKIAKRQRPAPVSVAATTGIEAAGSPKVLDEKQQAVLQLLKEAEDYARQANWAAAEKVYIKVVALAPKTLEAYLGLGNLYLRQKNWTDAAESYKLVIAGDPDNATAQGNLGQALANKGEWVAAVDALARAAKLDPGNASRHATLGLAYMTIKDYRHAVKALREAVKHDRENLSHKIELAKVAHLVGDKPLAEEMLAAVLTRDPLNEQAKVMLEQVRAKKDLE